MIEAALIIKPVIDKAKFHRMAESVTGQNYLRETDNKNLRDPTAEVISILNSYGEPHASAVAVPVGFIFAGTLDLISQIPTLVQGHFLSNQESNSGLIGSLIVIATLEQWENAINRQVGNVYLEKCFQSIRLQIENLISRPGLPRLN